MITSVCELLQQIQLGQNAAENQAFLDAFYLGLGGDHAGCARAFAKLFASDQAYAEALVQAGRQLLLLHYGT